MARDMFYYGSCCSCCGGGGDGVVKAGHELVGVLSRENKNAGFAEPFVRETP